MKLLYLLPHCSTGGMPQYVLKQIESFKDQFNISVLEVQYAGNQFVVQRNRIKSLVPFHSTYGNVDVAIDIIADINPDIIHCQEVPEHFLNKKVLDFLYKTDRKWFVAVTSHGSGTTGLDFMYLPDRIVAVNNWQKNMFSQAIPDLDIDIWEYPIENKGTKRLDFSHTGPQGMTEARRILGFKDYDYRVNTPHKLGRHILNVGLFTPGKNQGELFEIARQNPQNTYHFVGNQAENFREYWQPLMQNKPDNCIIWGERDDVDLFYKACDEMYFTSKLELNPLCVKEALSYGLPVKMYKLPTYGNDYDENQLVTYL